MLAIPQHTQLCTPKENWTQEGGGQREGRVCVNQSRSLTQQGTGPLGPGGPGDGEQSSGQASRMCPEHVLGSADRRTDCCLILLSSTAW
jgi:hypothetical protein